jgi:CheY-like chemotaxis protein
LFDAFQQAESSISREFGGTGLGLSISKSLIEMMNGEIKVSSEIGKGSTFTFNVIMKQPTARTTVDSTGNETYTAKEIVDAADENVDIDGLFTGHLIILAEDIEINREIVLTLLLPTGIQIHCAKNGEEALQLFGNEPDAYDLILMDLHMPKMDGLEATRKIREFNTSNAKSIPIIAITANVLKGDIERCLTSGMNGHIGKPIDFDELIAILKQYLC